MMLIKNVQLKFYSPPAYITSYSFPYIPINIDYLKSKWRFGNILNR